ncbi:DUF6151 family protein [Roseateles sp.]|uniref:DUF6151 family protein n=1 Tax=Roseateles sp. TaxID=1971397 RepID=UPI0039216D91
MSLPLSCRCGAIQGTVPDTARTARVMCYCRDCRTAQRWLDPSRGLDAAGGVDIIATTQAEVQLSQGQDALACLQLSPKGLYRWHCKHCRTPLGNTPAANGPRFVGLSRLAVALDDAALDARVGLPRWQAFAKSATGPVPALASRALLPTLKVVGRSLLDRLRALTPGNPFFDAQGQTRVQPHLMPREERAALRAQDR